MVEFAYTNAKNARIRYIFFEFNYKYYLYVFYKEDLDLYSKSKIANQLFFKL